MRNLKMANIKPPPTYKNRSSSKNDPINTALYLSEQRAKLHDRAQPYDVIGSVAANISNTLAGPNNNPQGWRGLVSGFAQGIAQGSQLSRAFQNEERAKAYEKALDYFEAVNQQKLQQQEYQDKLENAQKQITPDALAYLQNKQKDPQTSYIMGDRMWNKYSSLTGVDGKFLGVSPIDENVFMIQNADGLKLVDIRPLFLGDQYTQNAIASLDQDYQNKLQDQRLENQKYLDLEERKVQNLESINNKRGALLDAQTQKLRNDMSQGNEVQSSAENQISTENGEVPLSSLGKEFSKEWQKKVLKEVDQIPTNRRTIEAIQEMKDIFNKYPNIGSTFLNAVNTSGSDESFSTILARKGAEYFTPDEYAAVKELEKLTSDLNLSTVLGFPGKSATDILKLAIQKAAPSGKLPANAFNMIAESWDKRARENIEKAQSDEDALTRGMYIRNTSNNSFSPKEQIMQIPSETSVMFIEGPNGEIIKINSNDLKNIYK